MGSLPTVRRLTAALGGGAIAVQSP